ncbi:hypothetical protein ABPG72_010197 [Tetrahymena utriculariae]
MKNLHIKNIQEDNRGLDDSFLTQSDSGYKASSHPFAKKSSSLSKNEFYAKYLKKNFDFSQDDDLQVIYDIIQKQNTSKSNLDLMILQNTFKNIRLFQELENEIPQKQMFNLYRELLHYEYQPRQVVFNQGEIGREFYIILKGSVYIIGNEDKKQQDDSKQEQQASENQQNTQKKMKNTNGQRFIQKQQPLVQTNTSKLARRLSKKSSFIMYSQTLGANKKTLKRKQTLEHTPPSFVQQGKFRYNSLKRTTSLIYDIDEDITDEEYIKLNYPDYDILAKLQPGASFGEVALRDSVPRTATAICSGETHFITLKRDAFKRFLEQYYSVVQQQNINFVKKIALFSNWTDQMINQMFYYLEKKTFRMNQTIYKEGSDSLGIYLIREGEVKLYQEMQWPKNEQDKLKNVRHFMRKIDFVKQQDIFYAPISHLAQGQMFGHEDIVNSTQRKYTAICSSSNCQILFLNKERFLQLSKRRNTIENAFEESVMKQEWHSQLISKLESFTKNQNEFIKRQESQKQKLINNILEEKRNSQIFEKKTSKTQRKINLSLPSSLLNKQSCYQIDDFINQQHNHLKVEKICPEPNNLNNQEILLKNFQAIKENQIDNFQQIILLKQNCQNKSTKNDLKCKQDILDAFLSSATAENTPFQSEKLIRHSSNKNIFQKNQDISIIIEDQRLKTDSSKQRRPLSGLSLHIYRNTDANQVCQTVKSMVNIDLPNQKIQVSQSQIDISEWQINDFQYQSDQKHKNISSNWQKKLRRIQESNSKINKNESPIRKQSINQDFLRQLIDNSLHVPKRIQQSLSCQEESQINLEQQCQSKLDIDNQIIPTCQSMHLFKKRIMSKYPKLANEQKESNQVSLKQQINNVAIQQRILKSLKLPKIGKNSSNFIDIFMPIELQSQKNLDQKPQVKELNSSLDLNNQKLAQPNSSEISTPVKRNKSQCSISIIETLKNLKKDLIEKKIKCDVQIKDKQDVFRRKNLSQSNLLDEKHIFDLKKFSQQNYNFQNKFNDISHNPALLQQIFTKPNKTEEPKK